MYTFLAGCAEQAWLKCEKYYKKEDESPAYYAAILLNPQLKYAWFEQVWENNDEAQRHGWLRKVKRDIESLWDDEYKGKHSDEGHQSLPQQQPQEPRSSLATLYEKKANFKRIRLSPPTASSSSPLPRPDLLHEYCVTNLYTPAIGEKFDAISYWQQRYNSQRDLARFALDLLAIPPMADAPERLFSSAKLLLTDRRSRLKMDIIEANECLRSSYGPPLRGCFNDGDFGILEQEAGVSAEEMRQYEDKIEVDIEQTNGAGDDEGVDLDALRALENDDRDIDYDSDEIEIN